MAPRRDGWREVLPKREPCELVEAARPRYGGEEFLILLRNSDLSEASVIAERTRQAVELRPVGGLAISVSIGLATAPTHGTTPDELIKLADGALYDAKTRGRNLVRVHGDPEPPT